MAPLAEVLRRLTMGASIKSIQTGFVANTATQVVDVTIAAVDLSKSFVFVERHTNSETSVYEAMFMGRLTSSTNLQFKKKGSTAGSCRWTVIEFASGVKVQEAYASLAGSGGTSAAMTIAAVDASKTFIIYSGCQQDYSTHLYDVVLTNPTTVTATRQGQAYASEITAYIIEMK